MVDKSYTMSKIDDSKNKINSIWEEMKYQDLRKIKESWDTSLSDDYLEKFQIINSTILDIESELDLLKECWKKYNSEVAIDESKGSNNG